MNTNNSNHRFDTEIIFAHNSHNRPNTLIDTIKAEIEFFPNSQFYVSVTNDGTIKKLDFDKPINLKMVPTTGVGWQLGCVNCFYSCVSKICEDFDDGIIVFSHDDVRLRNFEVLKEKIELMIKDDLSYIVRRPGYGHNYFMMEAVLLNIKHVKKVFSPHTDRLFENEGMIPRDMNSHISAEEWMGGLLIGLPNGLAIDYPHHYISNEEVIINLIENIGYEHMKKEITYVIQ